RLKTEEIPQPLVQGYFDGALGGDESVQGAVPGLQLLEVNLNTALPRPARHEAPALPITDKIGLQPARQAVLTAGTHEAIGDQQEGAIGIGDGSAIVAGLGSAEVLIQDRPQAKLLKERADQENRSPGPDFENVHSGRPVGQAWFPAQDPFEAGEQRL